MTSYLLQSLAKQQTDSHSKGYVKGIFSSQRFHNRLPYNREDENIFFSSAIAYTLQEYSNQLSEKEQVLAKKIIEQIISSYPKFKNFRGGETYNFFKTNPMSFFPNGNIMRHFNFFKLADDADDTAYVYLTSTTDKHAILREKLVKHANGSDRWNFLQQTPYGQLKTYNVYFGEKMAIETDACVLCNILLWSFRNNLLRNQQDKDSITYLSKVITSKDYINTPYIISPCYPTTAQICYHISRLIKEDTNGELDILKNQLIIDLQQLLKTEKLFINQLFYHISLLNLGIKSTPKLSYQLNDVLKSTTYFYTSIPLMIPKLWARKLQKRKLFQSLGLRTRSDGYTTTLLLEYEILHKNT